MEKSKIMLLIFFLRQKNRTRDRISNTELTNKVYKVLEFMQRQTGQIEPILDDYGYDRT